MFLKKDKENTFPDKNVLENTISLSPQFLSYLMQNQETNEATDIETKQYLEE